MSLDARPSLRARFSSKIKDVIKPNVSSSIREKIISDDAYQDLRNKYRNFTDDAKDLPGIGKILNKTKTFASNLIPSNDTKTSPKGFYDSLFNPQTEEDTYFKTAVICLWVIAVLCIIPTIITIFLPSKRIGTKRTHGINMIFFHIFLCEFFYLFYILLSMINVALNFQMARFLCEFANYGVYVTVTVMYLAILLFAVERVSKELDLDMSCTKIFKNPCGIQIILWSIWFLLIVIFIAVISVKRFVNDYVERGKNIASPIVEEVFGRTISSSSRCSIDGRLSSVFKVALIILCIILFLLIMKSIFISVFYNQFRRIVCKKLTTKKKHTTDHLTLLFIIFIALNLLFSFPFYFTSISFSFTQLLSKNVQYPTKLKVYFLLRISSIILQCLTFYTFDDNSWAILSELLYRGTCKKVHVFKYGIISSTTKSPIETDRHPDYENGDTDLSDSETEDKVDPKKDTTAKFEPISSSENDDEVFEDESTDAKPSKKSVDPKNKEVEKTVDNKESKQKTKLSVRKTNEHKPSDESDEDEMSVRKLKSEYNRTNGTTRKPVVRKIDYQRDTDPKTDHKETKSNAATKTITKDTVHHTSSLSDNQDSSSSEEEHHDNKQLTAAKPKTQAVPTENKYVKIGPLTDHGSKHEHRKTRTVSSASANHHHRHHYHGKTKYRKPSRNKNKPEKDLLSKIIDQSIAV